MSIVPTRMRVIDVETPGAPEALRLVERPTPHVSPGEVLIKIAAAGLNRADILQRRGHYPPPPGTPNWPGMEVAGTIAAVAPDVSEFKPGDAVCALLAGGGYAEYCVAPPGQVLPLPAGLDMVGAASLPEAYFTVWSNVFDLARLKAGESLLVHGGASGIGVAAIQLARARGATVYATAGSDERCRWCEELGAQRAINHRSEDFVAVIRAAGGGVDVVLDMVGGDYLPRNLEALATEGRIVVIATQGGSAAKLDLLKLMLKRAMLTGTTLRSRPLAFKAAVKAALLREVWPLFERGELRPVVDRVFPLEQAAAAHAYMESGAHRGKIVLRVGD
ncbi:MAG TPA: NAD(P)H-quinone oxidoreductase [Nevskia sp.]|nr:NAD(P)H-quinone oxidoreductase [Nevskia sp.]